MTDTQQAPVAIETLLSNQVEAMYQQIQRARTAAQGGQALRTQGPRRASTRG
jgi:hypothetical protein